jgi:phage tail-like protein
MPEAEAQTTPAAASGAAAPIDPLRNFQFRVEIAGVTAGHFTEVSGLGVRVQTIRYREGGLGQIVRTLPGAVDYAEVTLRYGLTQSRELWTWMQATVQGRVERKNISIMMLGTDGATEMIRWNLIDAWPAEWQGAPLDAMGRDVAIETLKLAFDRLERA